jgi:hypothetical protein
MTDQLEPDQADLAGYLALLLDDRPVRVEGPSPEVEARVHLCDLYALRYASL